VEQTDIAEIDINPLIASPDGIVALDARVVLHDPQRSGQIPKPAIRPYPTQYVSDWKMKDGQTVTIRPIRPEDEPLMADFHRTLSDRTVYLRYFATLSLGARVAHERLLRICFGNYDREMVLVAEHRDPGTGKAAIVGVGRLNKLRVQKNDAEVAILVTDAFQNRGLGLELLRRVIAVARDEKLTHVSSEMLNENLSMQVISKKLGFVLRSSIDSPSVRAVLTL
jgi:acetyltransferase